MKTYQNYQIVKNTASLNSDDNWVELGPTFQSLEDVINYTKRNISSEMMEQYEYLVEYWNDVFEEEWQELLEIEKEPKVEWTELSNFIAEYLAAAKIKKSTHSEEKQQELLQLKDKYSNDKPSLLVEDLELDARNRGFSVGETNDCYDNDYDEWIANLFELVNC